MGRIKTILPRIEATRVRAKVRAKAKAKAKVRVRAIQRKFLP